MKYYVGIDLGGTNVRVCKVSEEGEILQSIIADSHGMEGPEKITSNIIDLVKQIAVETELNDINKRQAIYEKTGFNVTKAIEINHETEEETVIETKTRRAAPVSVSEKTDSPARRTAAPKYKVTSIAN